jgi:hypothetical protein
MRGERRGWERGLYGVRGNEVEKEEGDLKRSGGGVLNRVRSIAPRCARSHSGRTVWCARGVHCGRALWLYAREHT